MDKCTHISLKHHFINTITPTFKGPTSGCTSDAFQKQGQQNNLPHLKFNLVSSVLCVCIHRSLLEIDAVYLLFSSDLFLLSAFRSSGVH